jgi:Flp pilus assembly protein TadG
MILRIRRFRIHEERGSVLVEFALVCLLLTMLLVGVIDICRMILVYNDVSNGVAEGVRYAAVHGRAQTNASQVQTVVRNYLASAPMTPANATVNACFASSTNTCTGTCASRTTGPNAASAPIGSYVTVCVAYTYDPFSTYFPLGVGMGSQSQGVILY